MKPERPPFPFFGAGEAAYGEWALLELWFARKPTPRERAEITEAAPAPLRQLTWRGRLLEARSVRYVHRDIARTYGAHRRLTTRTVATAPQTSRFNSAIAAWLVVADATCPIQLAHRPSDRDAGGTKLSRWHDDSVAMLPRLWRELAAVPSQRLVRGVVRYAQLAKRRVPAWLAAELGDDRSA